MLRPPTAHCLDRLLAAADWSDRDLDRALCDVGVLPPVDLREIRGLLTDPGVGLAARPDPNGHSIVEVIRGGSPTALIHPDGAVQHLARSVA